MIWLRYHSMLALHDRPMLAMVNLLALELWQLFQYSYVCSNVMSLSKHNDSYPEPNGRSGPPVPIMALVGTNNL